MDNREKNSKPKFRAGMTLLETVIAMAIISLVGVICISAFMVILGSEARETNTRLASESVEQKIAVGEEAASTTATALEGEYLAIPAIPVDIDVYAEIVGKDRSLKAEDGEIDISGKRSYLVLRLKDSEGDNTEDEDGNA